MTNNAAVEKSKSHKVNVLLLCIAARCRGIDSDEDDKEILDKDWIPNEVNSEVKVHEEIKEEDIAEEDATEESSWGYSAIVEY